MSTENPNCSPEVPKEKQEYEKLCVEGHAKLQQKLTNKILELSKKPFQDPEKEIPQVLDFLQKQVYIKEFRHSYAEFFYVVVKINDDKYEGNAEILLQNLKLLEDEAYTDRKDNFKDVKKNVIKLCDHLALEIYRYQADNNKLELEALKQKIQEREVKVEEAQTILVEAKKNSDEATDKLKGMQGETVAIISIFSAIILAFSGGLSYLSSAISAVHNSPITKLILTVLVCGFILFNTVFILLYVVARMVDKNIFLNCNNEKCGDCPVNNSRELVEGKEPINKKRKPSKFLWFKKVKDCLPYIFALDVLLLVLIVAVIAFMFYQKTPLCPDWLK